MRFSPFTTLLICMALFLSGCDVIQNIAPPPNPTTIPTEVSKLPTITPDPTMGTLVTIDAVYCWMSDIDEAEYNLLRFFPSGTVIDVMLQPFSSCEDAWQKSKQYLAEDQQMKFNHGTYQLSGSWIMFKLAPAGSSTTAGGVKGNYSLEKMMLIRQGADQREYVRVNLGG